MQIGILVNKKSLFKEDNIRFELCYKLRELGINFTLNYKIKQAGKRGCFFDVAILNSDQSHIVGIIECKRTENFEDGGSERKYARNQIARYKEFGVPVYLMMGYSNIDNAINFAENCFNNKIHTGEISWNDVLCL